MMYGYNGYLYGNTVKSKVPEPDDRVPPHLRPAPLLSNPWSRSPSGLTSDILFIAEFSEIDGPKPVVWPLYIRWKGQTFTLPLHTLHCILHPTIDQRD